MNFSEISPKNIKPEEAMSLSDNDKRTYFKNVRVKHARVSTILEDMETMVLPESGTDIALLIGPTGVGKSTLSESLADRIIELHREEMQSDLSFIPVVQLTAPASGEKSFSWRIFYVDLGRALVEPLMDQKQEFRLQDGRMTVHHITNGSTVASLRMAVEGALGYRRTLLVIIDEAVHLLRHAKGNALAAHMDALKSLTTIKGITLTLALVGSYDLYQLMCLSGQLARRSAIVHFQRYRPGIAEDEKAFQKSLEKLQKYIPLAGMPDLTPLSEPLMQACVGCVGTLKETLQRALARALINKGKWTDACLQKALLAEGQITAILEETLKGEMDIEKSIFGSGKLNSCSDVKSKAA